MRCKVIHATGSRSFTQTLRKVAGARAPKVQKMFQYFNSFMGVEPSSLDALILDEAHRIRETSVNRWTKAEFRSGRPQIDELIAAARVPVFLLDEFQVVRPGEQGTVEDIEQNAKARGIRVEKISLDAQFRCGGSEEYLVWVKRLLGLTPGGPIPWMTARGGKADPVGWPQDATVDYAAYKGSDALARHPDDEGVWLGGIDALGNPPDGVDAVVSLCRHGAPHGLRLASTSAAVTPAVSPAPRSVHRHPSPPGR